jgi:hypothetical protein
MAETLGSLCDKLTIVKLKQYHTEDSLRLQSLAIQEQNLCEEIDTFIGEALEGRIPAEKLTFASNKVYKRQGNEVAAITGSVAEVFAALAEANCAVWHEQEKLYDFENVPAERKNEVMKQLAVLNLKRNNCIDTIDKKLQELIVSRKV